MTRIAAQALDEIETDAVRLARTDNIAEPKAEAGHVEHMRYAQISASPASLLAP